MPLVKEPEAQIVRVMTALQVDEEPSPVTVKSEARLEMLGYNQELKRDISMFETFGFAFSIMGVLPSIASTIFYNLPYGGPVAMTWGWLLAGFLILFVGGAMADLASSMPTSGGLYYWTHRLAHPDYRDFLAWMVGYNSFLGNISAVSSLAWATSGVIYAAVSINDNSFTASTAQVFGLYIGILILMGVFCAYGTNILARLQTPSVILNVLLLLVTIIGLPIAMRKDLNSASYTFGGWENLTGWNNGFAFILSFLAPVWTICSFDSAVSISEEATNAAIAVPVAIVGAIGSATITGFAVLVIFALTMGSDIEAVYNSDIGQPLAYIYNRAFGVKGSLAIWSFMCIAELMMTASLTLPASRQAFAFARDGALPFSNYFYSVNSKTNTPVRTVWLVVILAMPLGLLGFANDAAINAIFSLAIIGPYCAYAIPIACRVFAKEGAFIPGPWFLGRFSKPIAVIALIWMIFACIIFCFPADTNTDAASMNYAIVVAAAVWTFAIAYWYLPKIGGKTFFKGPQTHSVSFVEYGTESRGRTMAEEEEVNGPEDSSDVKKV
ncbi:amino acid transporter [Phaffia rhodozyma]|uniref:Amino acid transporter n=1 Tax=Phaffia rhodozyma TaxID=264483 RepID=A0A0F7SL00_PHARH|nr:amino acid transporter [Phaffia rhodozyma]